MDVLSPFGTTITIFGRFCGQLPDTAKWLAIHTSHTLNPYKYTTYPVGLHLYGAGLVRVHHMSPYHTCELDAPSPRFMGLMRSWLYIDCSHEMSTDTKVQGNMLGYDL